MDPERIAELLAPFLAYSPEAPAPGVVRHRDFGAKPTVQESAALSLTQIRHISIYIDILLRWNSRINLTSVRQPEEIVTRHFGESLFAARHLLPGRDTPAQAATATFRRRGSRVMRVVRSRLCGGSAFCGAIDLAVWTLDANR